MDTPALFLDLDDTLIEPVTGDVFPDNKEDWQFKPKVVAQAGRYQLRGATPIIVTNQGGIASGYITERAFIDKMDSILKALGRRWQTRDIGWFYCPDMDGYYRKPNPGMAYQAAMMYHLNLGGSLMVGDRDSDRLFAENAGIGAYMSPTQFTNTKLT